MSPRVAGFLRLASVLFFAGLFGACFQDKVAGGSSEVDNPIVVAFVDAQGASLSTSGTLSVYSSSQNPTVNPYPILTKQLTGVSSVQLTAKEFSQTLDSTRSYNLLLISSGDTVGALLQNLSYHPAEGRFKLDSAPVSQVKVPIVPLIRYEASLNSASDTGVARVFIPGTPFQSVVVDSSFAFDGVPTGTFPLHLLGGDGKERSLKPAGNGNSGNHHEVDSSVPPVNVPPSPPTSQPLSVSAGNDIIVPAYSGDDDNTKVSLSGQVRGADPTDARLGVLWQQILPGPQGAKATIEDPRSLNTRIKLPRPGTYQFILSATWAGGQRIADTVVVTVQSPPNQPYFLTPSPVDTAFPWTGYNPPNPIVWQATGNDSVYLDYSGDGGASWDQVFQFQIYSQKGPNSIGWYPPPDTTGRALLRLRKGKDDIIATSSIFQVRYHPASVKKAQTTEDSFFGNATGFDDDDFYNSPFPSGYESRSTPVYRPHRQGHGKYRERNASFSK